MPQTSPAQTPPRLAVLETQASHYWKSPHSQPTLRTPLLPRPGCSTASSRPLLSIPTLQVSHQHSLLLTPTNSNNPPCSPHQTLSLIMVKMTNIKKRKGRVCEEGIELFFFDETCLVCLD